MAFHDVRLPDTIEQEAQGGPTFSTSILELSTGIEKRNINWENSRGVWDIAYGVRGVEDINVVRDFFFARQGRFNTFRFKDWADFEIGGGGIPQSIGTGNNTDTVFIATKVYKSGPTTHTRKLTKLVAGTTRVFLDGVEQFVNFVVQPNDATITFTTGPPAALVDIGIIAEFDVHVRFAIDELILEMEQFDFGGVANIPLIEEREQITVIQGPLFLEVEDAVTVDDDIPTIVFRETIAIDVFDAVTIGEAITWVGLPIEFDTFPFNEDITVNEICTVFLPGPPPVRQVVNDVTLTEFVDVDLI